jgi:hypothetical protein
MRSTQTQSKYVTHCDHYAQKQKLVLSIALIISNGINKTTPQAQLAEKKNFLSISRNLDIEKLKSQRFFSFYLSIQLCLLVRLCLSVNRWLFHI